MKWGWKKLTSWTDGIASDTSRGIFDGYGARQAHDGSFGRAVSSCMLNVSPSQVEFR